MFIRQIVKRLDETLTSPVGFNTLGEGTEIGLHHTVLSYADFLRNSFAISMIYELDRNRDVPAFRKKKVSL
jgi:predicted AAA+ superfamily ATPase